MCPQPHHCFEMHSIKAPPSSLCLVMFQIACTTYMCSPKGQANLKSPHNLNFHNF